MTRSTIREWLQQWHSLGSRRRQAPRSLLGRLLVEELEARWVPATQNWTGASGGDWNNAANWNGSAGPVPGPADTAAFPANTLVAYASGANDSVTLVTGSPSISISSGSLTISDSATFSSLSLIGASTLGGAGTISVSGPTTWNTGDLMNGTGLTILDGPSTLGAPTLDTRTLDNFGPLTSGGTFFLANGAVANNEVGGSWSFNDTFAGITEMTGVGTFNNLGTLNSANSGGASVYSPTSFNNSGTVSITSGTFSLQSGNASMTNGAIVSGPGTFALGTTLTVTGSSFIDPTDFTFNNQILTGSGTVTVGSTLQWTNGTMSGTGLTILEGSSTISGAVTLDTRTLDNAGAVSDSATFSMLNNAVIDNDQGIASWTLLLIPNSVAFSGSGTFDNTAVFIEQDTGPDVVSVPFNNTDGDIDVNSGHLVLQSGGTDTGTDSIAPGAAIDYGGTYTLAALSLVEGAGSVTFNNATSDVSGQFVPTGPITISNSSVSFDATVNSTGSVTFASLTLLAPSTLTGAASITVTGATTWSGGTMSGTGVTNLEGATSFTTAATLDTRTLNNFGPFSDGATLSLANGAIINNQSTGTWTLNLPGNTHAFDGTGTFNNVFGFFIEADTGPDFVAVPFNNSGIINVQSGYLVLEDGGTDTGTDTVAATAILEIAGGTYNFNTGSVVEGPGSILFDNNGFGSSPTTSVSVNGGFVPTGPVSIVANGNVDDTTVTFNSTVNGTGSATFAAFALSGGTLTGPASITVNGTSTWSSGTMSGTGVTILQDFLPSSTFTFTTDSTGIPRILDTRTLDNVGFVSDGASLSLSNGAVINNEAGAIWGLIAPSSTQLFSGNGTFNQAGTFYEADLGPDFIVVPFNNSGFVVVQSGQLALEAGGTDTGSDSVSAGASLIIGGGTYNFNLISNVFGAGNVFFINNGVGSAATLANVNGNFSPTGVVGIGSNATATFSGTINDLITTGAATFSSFDLLGGTLTGPASITVMGMTDWSGGTMSGTGVTDLDGSTTIASSNSTPGASGPPLFLDTRTLNVFGNVTDTAILTLVNGAVINNEAGPTWSIQNGAAINGNGTFNDLGILMTTGSSTIGANFILTTGTLNGTGTLTLTGTADLESTLGGSGFLNLMGTSTVGSAGSTSTAGITVDTLQVNNFGTVTSQGNLLLLNGAIVTNEIGATWTRSLSPGQFALDGQGTFNNIGTFNETGPGPDLIGGNGSVPGTFTYINSGALNVLSGTLGIQMGGTDTGSDSVAAGATLEFVSGTYNLNSGATLTNTGLLDFFGGTVNANVGSNFSGSGSINFFGGTQNIAGGFSAGRPIAISVDTVTFANSVNGNGAVTFGTLFLNANSTLAGPATLTVTGLTTWRGGTMSGAGVTNLQGGATLTNTPATINNVQVAGLLFLDTRTLNISGTSSDSVSLALLNNAMLNNVSGGTMTLQAGAVITGSGTVNNNGMLQVAGNATIGAPLNNSGTLQVVSGTLAGNSAVINSGTVNVSDNTTFMFTTFTQSAGFVGGTTNGTGAGTLVGNVIINGGVISADASAALLTILGNFTQNSGGIMDVDIGGALLPGSSFDVLVVTGAAQLGGTLNITLINAFVPATGNSFQIITASSVSGTFSTVNGLSINTSDSFTVNYNAANVTLVVTAISSNIIPPVPNTVATFNATTAVWTIANVTTFTFGLPGDQPITGDWNGAGFDEVGTVRVDTSVVAPDGKFALLWSLDYNGNNQWDNLPGLSGGDVSFIFGEQGDQLVIGDWNGDGLDKIGVARGGPGGAFVWSLDLNDTPGGYNSSPNNYLIFTFGLAHDTAISGAWTGGKVDKIGVERANQAVTLANGSHPLLWVLDYAGTGVFSGAFFTLGTSFDSPLVGKWTGGGVDKVGVAGPGVDGFPTDIVLDFSGNNTVSADTFHFGQVGDLIFRGDWDDNGIDNLGVERAINSTTLQFTLDTTGNGVYNPSDAVFTVPGTETDELFAGSFRGTPPRAG